MIKIMEMSKIYRLGSEYIKALNCVNLKVAKGEFVAIIGPSGSGKSTLMNMIGCLDVPTSGKYWLEGVEVDRLNEAELAEIRNRKVGFVFQNFNLLPRLTAYENVELPLVYRGMKEEERQERVVNALELLGLGDRIKHKPSELSGGQQQRVAVARALAGEPSLILADEPTGALDSRSGQELMKTLIDLNEKGITIVLITHDMDVAAEAQRTVRIQDGLIFDDSQEEEYNEYSNDC